MTPAENQSKKKNVKHEKIVIPILCSLGLIAVLYTIGFVSGNPFPGLKIADTVFLVWMRSISLILLAFTLGASLYGFYAFYNRFNRNTNFWHILSSFVFILLISISAIIDNYFNYYAFSLAFYIYLLVWDYVQYKKKDSKDAAFDYIKVDFSGLLMIVGVFVVYLSLSSDNQISSITDKFASSKNVNENMLFMLKSGLFGALTLGATISHACFIGVGSLLNSNQN